MKYFTEPNGKFLIEIPSEWQYKNKFYREEEKSPFGFEPYENPIGAFQMSIYPNEKEKAKQAKEIQKYDTENLNFEKSRMDGGGFNMHIWSCFVEDNWFFAKYFYNTNEAKDKRIIEELKKVEKSLATLMILSESEGKEALIIDKYEKFRAALAASFDLKEKAMEGNSFIEFVIIIANQIDAYLRLSIVMAKQLRDMSDEIDISYLFQGENDPPVMERKIYKIAHEMNIIDDEIYNKLEKLYKDRNKIVHRYIISEITTIDLIDSVVDYEEICESVRLKLKAIEDLQVIKKVGIYKNGTPDNSELSDETLKMIYAQINDKHSLVDLYRKI